MSFHIPETLVGWPWSRQLNPYYMEVGTASSLWLRSFNVLDVKAQRAFDLCDVDVLRACCDLMMLLFIYDELSDCEKGSVVQEQAISIMGALRNPGTQRPGGESILGEISRQFWSRTVECAKASILTQERFIKAFDAYTSSVTIEAMDRDANTIRDIESYLVVRRNTIAAYPCFVFLELGMSLPEDVLEDPVIRELKSYIADIIIISNDICSYNVEQARGDTHNILTVAMHELGTDLDGALTWASEYSNTLEKQFIMAMKQVRSWGDSIDKDVMCYVSGLGNCARANDAWNFESQRYFGKEGLAVQRHRKVVLLPRKA
ncbi:terpenoid synthase [Coniophora puteana RWD-64-598 SS2]|uniref:Terpene synthase n=1 Tax=Coniophora puteana (strain RWD-64-598) TaxID=741705 RepID=A0A5M3MLS1_CONPW|nr:terpenoid synthase [Coniophora puteana RWD-64-598 SS2]EIW80053.1 terpenoid synthase [Coniophora puteana RWD-64-598 SS2]